MIHVVYLDLRGVGIAVVVDDDYDESVNHCTIEMLDMIRIVDGTDHSHMEQNFNHDDFIDFTMHSGKVFKPKVQVYFITKLMEHFVT